MTDADKKNVVEFRSWENQFCRAKVDGEVRAGWFDWLGNDRSCRIRDFYKPNGVGSTILSAKFEVFTAPGAGKGNNGQDRFKLKDQENIGNSKLIAAGKRSDGTIGYLGFFYTHWKNGSKYERNFGTIWEDKRAYSDIKRKTEEGWYKVKQYDLVVCDKGRV